MSVNQDIQKLEPGAVVELFEVDGSEIGADVLRFHRHTESGSIWWKGVEYAPYPVQTDGFSRTTDKPPTPTLQVANVDGNISQLCLSHDDMVGAKVTRRRTLLSYLDAVNFVDGPNLLTNGYLRDDVSGWTQLGFGAFTWTSTGQALMTGVAGTKVAYQDVAVTPGKQYLAKVRVISRIASAGVKCYDGANSSSQIGTTMNTAGITNYIVVTPTETTLRFSIEASSGAEIRVATMELHEYVGNPTADPDEEFAPEIWYIERKSSENNEAVTFELVSAMDLNGVKLPRRQIIPNYCLWLSLDGYRGANCGYTGPPVAKADGTPTTDPALDACGGKLSDCRLRQWPDNVLNFGGFPAAGLMRT